MAINPTGMDARIKTTLSGRPASILSSPKVYPRPIMMTGTKKNLIIAMVRPGKKYFVTLEKRMAMPMEISKSRAARGMKTALTVV